MAVIGHFDARVLAKDVVDAVSKEIFDAEIRSIREKAARTDADVQLIQVNGVTLQNIQTVMRGTPPKYHPVSEGLDWNDLEFGNHMMRSIGDGSTHAPPTNGEPLFFYTEVILTHVDGQYQNKLQRAWEYRGGKLHVRSFVSGTWYPWTTTTADSI